jgi:hypothetical protein
LVLAKSTGDIPVLYLPDGNKKILKRFSPTSIIENIKILRSISKAKPEAIIFECMALQPETQNSLSKIIRPTHIVITNVLPDHQEVMGKSEKENFTSIFQSINNDSKIFLTNEIKQKFDKYLETDNNFQILPSIETDLDCMNIPPQTINESWTLINGLSSALDLNAQTTEEVFNSFWIKINNNIKFNAVNNKNIVYNFLSINDLETTDKFLKHNFNKNDYKVTFILNCRIDRPIRTINFVKYINSYYSNIEVWLCGIGKNLAYRHLSAKEKSYLSDYDDLYNLVKDNCELGKTYYSLGNHKGMEDFISMIKNSTLHNGEIN